VGLGGPEKIVDAVALAVTNSSNVLPTSRCDTKSTGLVKPPLRGYSFSQSRLLSRSWKSEGGHITVHAFELQAKPRQERFDRHYRNHDRQTVISIFQFCFAPIEEPFSGYAKGILGRYVFSAYGDGDFGAAVCDKISKQMSISRASA
jgi:hypothetical protein